MKSRLWQDTKIIITLILQTWPNLLTFFKPWFRAINYTKWELKNFSFKLVDTSTLMLHWRNQSFNIDLCIKPALPTLNPRVLKRFISWIIEDQVKLKHQQHFTILWNVIRPWVWKIFRIWQIRNFTSLNQDSLIP